MVTHIETTSETPTSHTIIFKTPTSFITKLTDVYNKNCDDLTIIDKYIKESSQRNNDYISEYNYEINTDTNFNLIILFKHFFRAIGETQKYSKCNVDIANQEVTIKFDSSIDIKLKNNIKYDLLPLVSIHASYVIEGDEIINTIKYETLEDVSTYDCHTMLMDMIKDGILDVIDNIEQINGFHYTI